MDSLRYRRKQNRGSVELNIAPLIDMIFILLIFFLVTTSFVKESGVEVRRAEARSAKVQEQTTVIISLTEDNVVFMEGKPIDVRRVRGAMERIMMSNPNPSVVIAADRNSRSGKVIQVLDSCRLAGVSDVSVAARQPGS